MDKVKPYYETIEEFMRGCDGLNVTNMVLVALADGSDKDETRDIICGWNVGPFELGSIASSLQMHATYEYVRVNRKYLETNTEEEQNSETE